MAFYEEIITSVRNKIDHKSPSGFIGLDNIINRNYFPERYSVFLKTLRKLSIYKYKQRSIDILKTNYHFLTVFNSAMFPDKLKDRKGERKNV